MNEWFLRFANVDELRGAVRPYMSGLAEVQGLVRLDQIALEFLPRVAARRLVIEALQLREDGDVGLPERSPEAGNGRRRDRKEESRPFVRRSDEEVGRRGVVRTLLVVVLLRKDPRKELNLRVLLRRRELQPKRGRGAAG